MKIRSGVSEPCHEYSRWYPSGVVRSSLSDTGPAVRHLHLTPAYPPAGFRVKAVCPQRRRLLMVLLALLVPGLLVACSGLEAGEPRTPTPQPLAEEIVLHDWAGDLAEEILNGFTKEYGIKVKYEVYGSPEEAVANIRAHEPLDVVVLENEYIPSLVKDGLLAKIDYRHVPNFNHISANFRDLAYDPENKHSIPYSWGTTGLLVRSDLVTTGEPPGSIRWADMWEQQYAGRTLQWLIPRYTLGMALKSLGYSVNSEDPAELEAALERLIELKPNAIWLTDEDTSAYHLISGEAVAALGWAYDLQIAREENEDIVYLLPAEGTILWGDNFVIPANSSHKYEAELFLNYLLRPEVTARIVELNNFAMMNDAAKSYIDPEILNDPVVYPPDEDLQGAEILLPLSSEGEKLYAEIWERFLAAKP